MGGSLGLAFVQRGLSDQVSAYARRDETRKTAMARGVCHAVHDTVEAAVENADIILLCVPMRAMQDLLKQCAQACKPGAVITDVGSTKAELVRQADEILKDSPVHFVGSHPIAGSEKDGLDAAQVHLYEGTTVVVTTDGSSSEQQDIICDLWRALDADVVLMTPEEHDRILARTSHLPHLISAALAMTVGRDDSDNIVAACGTGLRDTTRLADGASGLWRDIIETNTGAIVDELEAIQRVLSDVTVQIKEKRFDDVEVFLARCRTARGRICKGRAV